MFRLFEGLGFEGSGVEGFWHGGSSLGCRESVSLAPSLFLFISALWLLFGDRLYCNILYYTIIYTIIYYDIL